VFLSPKKAKSPASPNLGFVGIWNNGSYNQTEKGGSDGKKGKRWVQPGADSSLALYIDAAGGAG